MKNTFAESDYIDNLKDAKKVVKWQKQKGKEEKEKEKEEENEQENVFINE